MVKHDVTGYKCKTSVLDIKVFHAVKIKTTHFIFYCFIRQTHAKN